MSKLSDLCEEIYIRQGQSGVYDFIIEAFPDCPWEFCEACDCVSPAENHLCLVCGERTREHFEEWD